MEKHFKAIVSHSGNCMGHSFKRGIETVLPESVINALGENVKVVGEHIAQDTQKAEDVINKDIKKPFLDRMIHNNQTETK